MTNINFRSASSHKTYVLYNTYTNTYILNNMYNTIEEAENEANKYNKRYNDNKYIVRFFAYVSE